MITQRRQANTSVSLSVCVNMVYIRMCMCVCVCLRFCPDGTAGAPERANERTNDRKHDNKRKKKCCNKTRNKRQFHWTARVRLRKGTEGEKRRRDSGRMLQGSQWALLSLCVCVSKIFMDIRQLRLFINSFYVCAFVFIYLCMHKLHNNYRHTHTHTHEHTTNGTGHSPLLSFSDVAWTVHKFFNQYAGGGRQAAGKQYRPLGKWQAWKVSGHVVAIFRTKRAARPDRPVGRPFKKGHKETYIHNFNGRTRFSGKH